MEEEKSYCDVPNDEVNHSGILEKENDQLEGEEPSSLWPSANRTAERGGSGRL